MDMRLTEQQQAISDNVAKVCSEFDDGYWSGCEADERFPQEFVSAMAAGGWLGITMPEAYGGSALGVTEAALMMHAVSKSGGGQAASSSVHINLFGPHPIVVMGTDEQKQRMLPPIIRGEHKVAFGVTEPNAGSDTTSIETFAEKVEGGYRVNGRKMWTSTAALNRLSSQCLYGSSFTCRENDVKEMTTARNSCATLPRPATTSMPTRQSFRTMS